MHITTYIMSHAPQRRQFLYRTENITEQYFPTENLTVTKLRIYLVYLALL